MERTNYVDKAKRLMMQTVRTGALIIVPLAAAVSQMHAGTVLPSGLQNCNVVSADGANNYDCSNYISLQQLPGSSVTGLSFSGTLFIVTSSGGMDTITMEAGGLLAGGPLMGSIPVSYDFTGSSGGFNVAGTWDVQFSLGSTSGGMDFGSTVFSGSFSNSSGGTFIGSGMLNISGSIASGSALYETVQIQVPVLTGAGVQIAFPFNFDAVGAPEPGSVGLLGAGLGLLSWLGLRRRGKS
jgi:hypothetical protein